MLIESKVFSFLLSLFVTGWSPFGVDFEHAVIGKQSIVSTQNVTIDLEIDLFSFIILDSFSIVLINLIILKKSKSKNSISTIKLCFSTEKIVLCKKSYWFYNVS